MTLRNLLRASLLALVFAAPAARAGGFSTTNVQLLQGWNFDKAPDVLQFEDGTKTTLTLNQFSTWEKGDSFFFLDAARGKDLDSGAELSDVYFEWHPRLFVDQLLGQKEPLLGVIRHWGAAGEVNQGNNFYAYMGGLGLDFAAPKYWVLGLNIYYRYDNVSFHGWQVSPYWTIPINAGPVDFLFTGFVDVNRIDLGQFGGGDGIEIWAQPQLLVDVLGPFGGPKGKLYAGAEWYLHSTRIDGNTETVSAPQAMVQWTIF